MLRSSNPILSKQDAFTPAAPQQYGQNPYGQQSPYAPQQPGYGQPPVGTDARMTFDDVIVKTLLCLGVVGTYLGRVYEEVRRRPLYVVAEDRRASDST